MGKHLKNYSLRLKIILIIFLNIFLLCTCAYAKENPLKRLNEQIATLYQQGRYSEATEVAEKALPLAEKTFEPDHPDVAQSLNNLAVPSGNSQFTDEAFTRQPNLFSMLFLIAKHLLFVDQPLLPAWRLFHPKRMPIYHRVTTFPLTYNAKSPTLRLTKR